MKQRKTISLILAALLGMAAAVPAFAYSFTDVDDSYWGLSFVESAFEKGVVSGYPDGSFKPEKQVSYQEAATMICNTVKSSGYKPLEIVTQSKYAAEFTVLAIDENSQWAKAFLSTLFSEDAASLADFRVGSSLGSASSPAQRQVIGAWAARMLELPVSPLCDVSVFTDAASIDGAYIGEVDALVRCGIMSGYTDGSFGPEKIVKRGEFATVCVKMFDAIEALKEKEGKHLMEESLFLKTGYIQGIDAENRTLTFSFGGTYTVPESVSIVADGKAVEFGDLASLADSLLVVSYVKDQESALILQTAPMVEKGTVRSISTEGDFWLVGILTGSGLTVNYFLPMDEGVSLPSVGDSVSFIAEGARIIEMQ